MFRKLIKIQAELKAPKNQWNSFGCYKYRSCEDILEGVKPLLAEEGLSLTLSDEAVSIEDWHYIKATATLTDGTNTHESTAYAREATTKKGMDASQITGTASSYARKYALNGLFLIDDTKDADADENHKTTQTEPEPKPVDKALAAAKSRLWEAVKFYAEQTGGDAKKMADGVKKRPEHEDTAEFYNMVAEEFENGS